MRLNKKIRERLKGVSFNLSLFLLESYICVAAALVIEVGGGIGGCNGSCPEAVFCYKKTSCIGGVRRNRHIAFAYSVTAAVKGYMI